MNKLEKEFEDLCSEYKDLHNEISPKIKEQLEIANSAMKKALAISEENGLPFVFMDHEGKTQEYVPLSMIDGKYIAEVVVNNNDKMRAFIENFSNIYLSNSVLNNGGWYSSNC